MILRLGDYFQGRYEILEQIGSGGMSVVYKAKCHKLNRLVAIKVLKEEFCSDDIFVSKFKMEAQAAAGLTHANIVNVYDVIDDGNYHCIVMELVEGITLKNYIMQHRTLDAQESIAIAIKVAEGIGAAHEQHIVHRDIKPQNILISHYGDVKVADFGIARAVSGQTQNSAAVGSVHYISPEQARGGYSDERSDIYSFGITLFEMLTGQVPFSGNNTVAIALAHLESELPRPSSVNPSIMKSLENIILKCTEKKPEYRYQSTTELVHDLTLALSHPSGDYIDLYDSDIALEGKTVVFSNQVVNKIKERKRPIKKAEIPPTVTKKKIKKKPETSTPMEKLVSGMGVIVAILIVVIAIAIVSKMFSMFDVGPLLTSSEVETMTEEETLSDKQVYMPDVLQLTEAMAEAKLNDSYINMKCSYEYVDGVEKGFVASQDPKEGEIISKWSNAQVVISKGSNNINLSELAIVNMPLENAKELLGLNQVTVTVIEEEHDTIAEGNVISGEPESVMRGGEVTLTVSLGPKSINVLVPNIANQIEVQAISMLKEAGLQPGNATFENHDTIARGYVITYDAGTSGYLEAGSKVNYVVSLGEEEKQRYVASINETYSASNLIGPGSTGADLSIIIRLHQVTDGEDIYYTLTEVTNLSGNILIPINYTSILSMNGTDQGEVEVVDAATMAVLKTYPLTFFPMS